MHRAGFNTSNPHASIQAREGAWQNTHKKIPLAYRAARLFGHTLKIGNLCLLATAAGKNIFPEAGLSPGAALQASLCVHFLASALNAGYETKAKNTANISEARKMGLQKKYAQKTSAGKTLAKHLRMFI